MHIADEKTIELLSSGNNIGITLAETPLMRKALLLIKPKTIMELATCLSIIRPAAADAKKEFELGRYSKNSLVFDDDVIYILSKLLKCSEEKGFFMKNTQKIHNHLNKKSSSDKRRLTKLLENQENMGFVKHTRVLCTIIWQLAIKKHIINTILENTIKAVTVVRKCSDFEANKWYNMNEKNL